MAVNADGSGDLRIVAPPQGVGSQRAYFAADGRTAIRLIDEGGRGLMRLSPVLADGSLGPPAAFLHSQREPNVEDLRPAPKGGLIAYATDDPGLPEVFLVRQPGGEGPWQVSAGGGRRPRWARDSGELFYIGGGGPSRRAMFAVSIDASTNPPASAPTRLFDIDPTWLRNGEMPYDVTADGKRFLMAREAGGPAVRPRRMVLVQNWDSALEKPSSR